jgi:hypothetical protein
LERDQNVQVKGGSGRRRSVNAVEVLTATTAESISAVNRSAERGSLAQIASAEFISSA